MIFDEVKIYLNITWNDLKIDQKLQGIIRRAEAVISGYAGVKLDMETMEPDDEQLFLDLCRYIYNDTFEDFEVNFIRQINGMRCKYKIRHFKAEQEDEAARNA